MAEPREITAARLEGRREERERVIRYVETFGRHLEWQMQSGNPFHEGRREAAREIERWLKAWPPHD